MLKYAIINNNRVENIITCESTDFVEHIKLSCQHIEFVGDDNNSKDIQIGYLWDGSKFFEDPIIVQQREEQQKKFEEYINSLKEKPAEELTEEEKIILEMEKGI